MKRETVNYLIKVFFWGMVMTGALLVANYARGDVGKTHSNSLGTVSYTQNPYVYEAVNEVAEANEVDGNLNLRINPVGTYMLYDENILLCGWPAEKFQGIATPFVLTYERVSQHSVRGVGCHVLLRVDSLKTKESLGK